MFPRPVTLLHLAMASLVRSASESRRRPSSTCIEVLRRLEMSGRSAGIVQKPSSTIVPIRVAPTRVGGRLYLCKDRLNRSSHVSRNGDHVYQFYQGGIRSWVQGANYIGPEGPGWLPPPGVYDPYDADCIYHYPRCGADAYRTSQASLEKRAIDPGQSFAKTSDSCSISWQFPAYPATPLESNSGNDNAQVGAISGKWYDMSNDCSFMLDKLGQRQSNRQYQSECDHEPSKIRRPW